MRRILKAIAAALAAMTNLAWETVNGVLRLVQKVLRPPQPPLAESEIPLAESEAIAKAFETEHDNARQPGRDGVTHRYALGLAAGMFARGFSEYAAELPDNVVTLVCSLSPTEREALGRMPPDEIEAWIVGSCALAKTAPMETAADLTLAHKPATAPEFDDEKVLAMAPRFA
jgi:hypothetical protein